MDGFTRLRLELLYFFVMNSVAHNKRMNRDTTSESITHSHQASLWEVRYVLIEDNREDPTIPCCRRPDADPVDRDLPEQFIRGYSGNPGIHFRPDWNRQSGLRTGLWPGSIKDDRCRVRNLYDSCSWRLVCEYDSCSEYRTTEYLQIMILILSIIGKKQ